MTEAWKPVPGFVGLYEVSSEGRFRVTRNGRIKACTPMKQGYLTIKLCKGGVAKTFRAHKLVLAAFRGDCPPNHQTRHLNNVKSDNRLENLEWGTAKENRGDQIRSGTATGHFYGKSGSAHPLSKLTAADAIVIHALAPIFGQQVIAEIWGVTQGTISRFMTGSTGYRQSAEANARSERRL